MRRRSPVQESKRQEAAPIRFVIRPMDRWARDAMPCEKTVHGELPRLAATSIASPVPNSHRPNTSDAA